TLVVRGTVNGSGNYTNTATKSASTPSDPVAGNNVATASTTPVATADVAMTNVVDNPTPTVGEIVAFTITAKDNGPGNASGIVVQDLLPNGYAFSSKSVFTGTYDETTGVWNVGILNFNQLAT